MAARALATAFVNIVPGTQDMEAYLKSKFPKDAAAAGDDAGTAMSKGMGDGFGSKIKGAMGPALATIGAAFSAAAIGNFLKDAITSASDFNEQGTAVGTIFGTAASEIQKFADNGAGSLGQTKTQVLEAAKNFGIYGKAAGLAGDDNAKFSEDLIGLATDLASFNNTSVDEAIAALGGGLRGESEPLRKFGVLLTEGETKAKGMEMGLGTMTKTASGFRYTMTEQEKILARNAVIMEQTTTQQGDFARTSEGLANQQRILDANMGNLAITVGTALLPIVNNLTSAFNGFIMFVQDNLPVILPIAAGLATILLGIGANALYMSASTAIAAAGGLPAVIASTWAWTAALLANPITWIVLGVAALIAGIVALAMNWDNVVKFLEGAWAGFMSWIDGAFKNIAKWWEGLWDGIRKFVEGAWQGIVDWFSGALQWLVDLFLNWTLLGQIIKNWDAIAAAFSGAWDGIVKWFDGALAGFTKGWEAAWSGLGGFIEDTFNNIVNFVKAPLNLIIGLINDAIDGVNSLKIEIPDWVPLIGGTKLGFDIPHIPKLAAGGFVDQPTTALIGEAGPEVVTPLKDFERMIGLDKNGGAKTVIYNAAPNNSLDAEQALFQAMRRAKVVANW